MNPHTRRLMVVPLLLVVAAGRLRAQTSETPVPFDSAGRILSVSDRLATRLGIGAPAWPVTGAFVEARFYRVSDGSYVIVVQRGGGLNDRYALTSDQANALRAAFAAATARVGNVVSEDAASMIAEPASAPFVRDQMLLSTFMYGPAIASLTHDGTAGTVAYLLTVGGTFFVLSDFSKGHPLTRAQNSMATDGALRGWAYLGSTLATAKVNLNADGGALVVLAGGIGGSVLGYQMGQSLTNSEAQASMTGSTLSSGAAVGLTALAFGKDATAQEVNAAFVAAGVAGYLLGPRYPRRASYTVTAGDVQLVRFGALLGTLAAITPVVDNHDADIRVIAGLATTGWIGGALIADRMAARPFNYSESNARMTQLGALGGALMVEVIPVLTKSSDPAFHVGAITAGGILGAVWANGLIDPPRDGAAFVPPASRGSGSSPHLEFQPQGLVMMLTKQQGNHSLLRITF